MATRKLTDRALDEHLPSWGVLVLESHHSPEFSMDHRKHEFIKVVYVLRGSGVMEFADRVFRFKEGDVIVVPPQTTNRIVDAPDAASSLYVCCVAPRLFDFDPDCLATLRLGILSGDAMLSSRIATMLRRMRYVQSGDPRPGRSLPLVAEALRLVEWLIQVQSPPPTASAPRDPLGEQERILRYIKTLETEFYEATTIDAAASSLGMSRRTFTKRFQETTGKTWLTYVRDLMIRHAKHQLVQTNLSIASVAFECGFNDLSTFYRQFKSHVGMSPRSYRESVTAD